MVNGCSKNFLARAILFALPSRDDARFQIGMAVLDAPDLQSALERVRTRLASSGELSPQWVSPKEDTNGVQIVSGDPSPVLIDSDAIPLDEPPR
jgi:hypothetical protein